LEGQVKIVCNLVHLCLLSAAQSHDNHVNATEPKRLLFASTITVVGRYPTLNPSGSVDVPEIAVDPQVTETFGYPESKWVCEQILLRANELFGVKTDNLKMPLLRTSSVRIGQLTGPEQSGTWNETEHFPIIVRTSQMIKALPYIEGVSAFNTCFVLFCSQRIF
jgi:thioester reductase-like protein